MGMTTGIQGNMLNVINCMPGNVYWLDKHGIMEGCNQNVLDMLGLHSQAEFVGLDFEGLGKVGGWQPDTTAGFKRDTLEVIQTGIAKLNIEEPPIPHCDGRVIYFLTSRVPLFDNDDNIIGAVGISVDITDRKLAESRLRKALAQVEKLNRAKSEFIANMSHDIKTPLSGMIGMAEVLAQHPGDPENAERIVAIQKAGYQLMNLFDSCIAIANSENADPVFNKTPFSLRKVLSQLEHLFLPGVQAKQLAFSISLDTQVPDLLTGCEAGVYRVLLNLIGNAVKFTHAGKISIRVSPCKKSTARQMILKIIVEDTGIGIAEEKQKIIFERFTRLMPSWQGIYEGSGIGLYIVNRFVKSMGGEIHIRSTEKKGSRFIVILPFDIPLLCTEEYLTENLVLQDIFSRPDAKSPVRAPVSGTGNAVILRTTPRVLLVEDSVLAQKIAESLLSTLGCETELADSGKQALTLFEPDKYELILMDIGLPDFPGYTVTELVRRIEQQQGAAGIPIIGLTAHITPSVRDNCLASGMDDILEKPLSLEKGRKIILSHISHAKACNA